MKKIIKLNFKSCSKVGRVFQPDKTNKLNNDVKRGKFCSLRHAFTLAEVLIVIGIIGVIAEITIPTLMQTFQDKVAATSLKKAYSIMSQAYTLAVQENGTPDNWALVAIADPTGAENILNTFAPYLKIIKNCGRNTGCSPDVIYKWLNGGPSGNYNQMTATAKAQLADGSLIYIYSYGACNVAAGMAANSCGSFLVDINGFKGPNQIGVDSFIFYLTTKGIAAPGTQVDTSTNTSFSGNCANKTTASGQGCTAWVIYNENMDYLKCSGLSWSGPTKCN